MSSCGETDGGSTASSDASAVQRRFGVAVGRPGKAREARDTVRQSLVAAAAASTRSSPVSQPLDYEAFVTRHGTALQNDPHRDLLLFPRDDFAERVTAQEDGRVAASLVDEASWVLSKQCLRVYSAPNRLVQFNYAKFGGDYLNLIDSLTPCEELPELVYEIDMAVEESDDLVDQAVPSTSILKEGILLQLPDKQILEGFKSAKRRWCVFSRSAAGALSVELRKESGQSVDAAAVESVAFPPRKGKFVVEVVWADGKRAPLLLTTESGGDGDGWQAALSVKVPPLDLKEDAQSTGSTTDSGGGGDSEVQRYERATGRALQPPSLPRRDLFSLYADLDPLPTDSDWCLTAEAPKPKDSRGVRFLVHFKGHNLVLFNGERDEQVEPFNIRFYLFDAKLNLRVSEEFQISPNAGTFPSLVGSSEQASENESHSTVGGATQAWFSVIDPHPQVFLMVRVDRLLHQYSFGSDLYSKNDLKTTQKLQRQMPSICAKLGSYWTSFAWTARPVFQELLGNESTDCLPLYKYESGKICDQDVAKHLPELAKAEKAGKLTTLANTAIFVNINLTKKPSESTNIVKPSQFAAVCTRSETHEAVSVDVQHFCSVAADSALVAQPYDALFNTLYVYPLSLKYDNQKTFAKARNIVCRVRLVDAAAAATPSASRVWSRAAPFDVPRQQAWYARKPPSSGADAPTAEWAASGVSHHDVWPAFCDELKLALPLALTPAHHLLFSFGHVTVAAAAKPSAAEAPAETNVGYAWLPLLADGRLVLRAEQQEVALRVAADLPAGYLSEAASRIRWLDGGKALFRIKLRLVSSVLSPEEKVHLFFEHTERVLSRTLIPNGEDIDTPTKAAPSLLSSPELDAAIQATQGLSEVDPSTIILFLPSILHQLLALVNKEASEDLTVAALRTLVAVVDAMARGGHSAALRRFVQSQLGSQSGVDGVHERLCKWVATALRTAGADATVTTAVLRNAAFFLQIVGKSMALSLLDDDRLKLTRSERFAPPVLFRLETLVQTLAPLIVARHADAPTDCAAANAALANFLRCCFCLVDRAFVFRLVYLYVEKLDKSESKPLRAAKHELLLILSMHEHWLPLNLPALTSDDGLLRRALLASVTEQEVAAVRMPSQGFLHRLLAHLISPPSPKAKRPRQEDTAAWDELRVSAGYCKRHFLVGLLLQELEMTLTDTRQLRHSAIKIVRNLLAKHAADSRYNDQVAQSKIAVLYLPLVSLIVEHNLVEEMCLPDDTAFAADASQPTNALCPDRLSLSAKSHSPQRSLSSSRQGTLSSVVSACTVVAALAVPEGLDEAESRDLLICVLHVIKYVPEDLLGIVWQHATVAQLAGFLSLLRLCLHLFSYQGRKKTMQKTANKLRLSKRTLSLQTKSDGSGAFGCSPFSVLQEANMAQEVALTVLNCLGSFAEQCKERLGLKLEENRRLLDDIFSLQLSLLTEQCAEGVRLHALALLANFVQTFTDAVFGRGDASLLARLCRALLLQLASRLGAVRRSASALLLLLLRASHRLAGERASLGVAGARVGVALAELLGEGRALPDCAPFHAGLASLAAMASADRHSSAFDQLVLKLSAQLRDVLAATRALREAENRPTRLAELHVRLADNYRGSPSLRRTWLESLARLHCGERAFAEAAVCHLHCAAIIARHLTGGVECDWRLFETLSSNVLKDESAEGVVGVAPVEAVFEEDDFVREVEEAAALFMRAERYEALGPLYRLIVPIYERQQSYKALGEAYSCLQHAYSKAASLCGSGRRCLATYFRVVFYGQMYFGAEHGREWVYKEAGHTSLAEAADRLRAQTAAALGHDRVVLLPVDGGDQTEWQQADDENAYIRITHVLPTPMGSTSDADADEYAAHTNVARFHYETLLTEETGGGRRVTRQGMRRVYLTTGRAFPYLLRRLPVVSRGEQILTPLQVALDQLAAKNDQLRATLKGRPNVDLKRLQLQLQGAVQTTVNAGALSYAEAFTAADQQQRYGADGVDRLKQAFKILCATCAEALEIDGELILADQTAYHRMLVGSFDDLVHRLTTLFGEPMLSREETTEAVDQPFVVAHNSRIFNSISAVGHR